jgi:hypothetical protein
LHELIALFPRDEAKPLDSSRSSARGSARSNPQYSSRSEIPESSRDTLSTSRAHTAMAALAAEKQQLESRLASIDALLEQENKKTFTRPRGRN